MNSKSNSNMLLQGMAQKEAPPLSSNARSQEIMRLLFIIIFLGIFLLSCTIGSQDVHWSYEDNIERELTKSKVDSENLSAQINELLIKDYDIEGQWDSKNWHDGVHLTIKRRADGKYAVIYYARGDLASWTLMRIGTFNNGVLTFEKAVKEYTPFTPYIHFYLIRSSEGVRFVSQSACRNWIMGKEIVNWGVVELIALEKNMTEQQF